MKLFMIPILASFTLGAVAAELPRTPEGKPDLQGIWTNATQTPLERPERFGDRQAMSEEEALELQQRALAAEERGNAPSDPDRPPPSDGNTAAA
ncbi:MAG TPA: hypothetical protein DEG76_16470 [Pseudohongiella sp.]|nr:hypothetical protein [Pseudohongiella sp.]